MTAASASAARSSRKAYGEDLAANYGVEGAPHMVTRVLQHAELAVTELLFDRPPRRVSDPPPREDAFLICCQFLDRASFEIWEGERALGANPLRAGDTTIRDLRREPRAMTDGPLHSVLWYLPRAVLKTLADEASVPYVDELRADPRFGVADERIRRLSLSMLPALKKPEQVNRLFADHASMTLAGHVAQAYGGMRTDLRLVKGCLAPWQQRRAKEMMVADLTGATPLAEIAAACRLSSDYFARAFRTSTGLAPHAWLLRARVDQATTLLGQRDLALSEIALACGFVDQSHFTRVFVSHVGITPGVWRSLSIR